MNDDDLKKRFDELRARDARHAPSFAALTSKRPRRASRLYVIMPMVAAAAVFVVWCGATTTMRSASAPASAVAVAPPSKPVRARAPAALPLDFLLETTPISVHLDSEGLLP